MARSRKAARSQSFQVRVLASVLSCAGWLAPSAAGAVTGSSMGMGMARQLEVFGAVAVPTLGEWGMLFATLSLLAAGTSVILSRRRR